MLPSIFNWPFLHLSIEMLCHIFICYVFPLYGFEVQGGVYYFYYYLICVCIYGILFADNKPARGSLPGFGATIAHTVEYGNKWLANGVSTPTERIDWAYRSMRSIAYCISLWLTRHNPATLNLLMIYPMVEMFKDGYPLFYLIIPLTLLSTGRT